MGVRKVHKHIALQPLPVLNPRRELDQPLVRHSQDMSKPFKSPVPTKFCSVSGSSSVAGKSACVFLHPRSLLQGRSHRGISPLVSCAHHRGRWRVERR